MSYAYSQKKRETAHTTAAPPNSGGAVESAVPNSVRLAALQSGAASPTAAEKGNRVDLPAAMRAKMESSFGMDFSAVKLYESRALEGTGAEAMARGNEIAFAPGKLDFASMEGQSLLGHELSHVASQARGEVHGSGFLNDHALEHRADMEGAMAARGESVFSAAPYGGAVAPLSAASAAPMAGPMQASKKDKEEPNQGEPERSAAAGPELIFNNEHGANIKSAWNWNSKKHGFGKKPWLATAKLNIREYGKNLNNKIKSITNGMYAEEHKDFMSKKRKDEISDRGDADMFNMMVMDEDDLKVEN